MVAFTVFWTKMHAFKQSKIKKAFMVNCRILWKHNGNRSLWYWKSSLAFVNSLQSNTHTQNIVALELDQQHGNTKVLIKAADLRTVETRWNWTETQRIRQLTQWHFMLGVGPAVALGVVDERLCWCRLMSCQSLCELPITNTRLHIYPDKSACVQSERCCDRRPVTTDLLKHPAVVRKWTGTPPWICLLSANNLLFSWAFLQQSVKGVHKLND